MKIAPLSLLPLLLLTGCQTGSRPYAPVENVRYAALGHDPFWMVTIGDDRILLDLARGPDAPANGRESHVFARTLPRTVDGVRSWQSGDGTRVIGIEARPGRCEGAGGIIYPDQVVVRLSGRELRGCGGRPLAGGNS